MDIKMTKSWLIGFQKQWNIVIFKVNKKPLDPWKFNAKLSILFPILAFAHHVVEIEFPIIFCFIKFFTANMEEINWKIVWSY